MQGKLWRVASSPHIRAGRTTRGIMLDVIVALLPAGAFGVAWFGLHALWIIAVSVLSAVAWEALWCWMAKKPYTVRDLSGRGHGAAAGIQFAANGAALAAHRGHGIAIVLVKQCFGGLGQNFMNPALAARAILMSSWVGLMSGTAYSMADAMTSATPLAQGAEYALDALFWGTIPGCIGEVCKPALLAGLALFACASRDFLARPGHDAARQFRAILDFPGQCRKRSAAGAVWRLDPGRVFHGHGLLLFSHDAGGQAHHGRGVRVGVVCDPHLQFFARRLFLCDIVHEFGHASH